MPFESEIKLPVEPPSGSVPPGGGQVALDLGVQVEVAGAGGG